MDSVEEIAERVRRLEDLAFEGDGLTRAVTRLGANAQSLGDVLLTVDRQQQTLTRLGSELKEVRDVAVPRAELRERETAVRADTEIKVQDSLSAMRAERRRSIKFWAPVFMLTALAMMAVLAFTINSDNKACKQRGARLDIHIGMYGQIAEVAPDSSPAIPYLLEGIRDLEETAVDCDRLYPVHW